MRCSAVTETHGRVGVLEEHPKLMLPPHRTVDLRCIEAACMLKRREPKHLVVEEALRRVDDGSASAARDTHVLDKTFLPCEQTCNVFKNLLHFT